MCKKSKFVFRWLSPPLTSISRNSGVEGEGFCDGSHTRYGDAVVVVVAVIVVVVLKGRVGLSG